MSKTKSRRRPSRPDPVEKFAGPVVPRSDLQIELDSFDCEFTNASNVLHCVVQTIGASRRNPEIGGRRPRAQRRLSVLARIRCARRKARRDFPAHRSRGHPGAVRSEGFRQRERAAVGSLPERATGKAQQAAGTGRCLGQYGESAPRLPCEHATAQQFSSRR